MPYVLFWGFFSLNPSGRTHSVPELGLMFVILEIGRHYFEITLLLWKILIAKCTSLLTTTSVGVICFFIWGVSLAFLSKSFFLTKTQLQIPWGSSQVTLCHSPPVPAGQ